MSKGVYLTHMYIWSFYYKIVYGKKTYGIDSFLLTSVVAVALTFGYLLNKGKIKIESIRCCFRQ